MLLTVQQPSLSPNELSKDNAFSQVILCFDFDVIIGFMPEKHGLRPSCHASLFVYNGL